MTRLAEKIKRSASQVHAMLAPHAQKDSSFMTFRTARQKRLGFLSCGFLIFLAAGLFSTGGIKAARSNRSLAAPAAVSPSSEALRLNTLGVAYMNQQKGAEAQKYFERALAADPNFAAARLNLGVALLAQQKLDQARAALEEAAAKLPDDPFAWYNLGLVYKDLSEYEKAIEAFKHVEKIAPQEPDAFYFEGFLNAQLQRY